VQTCLCGIATWSKFTLSCSIALHRFLELCEQYGLLTKDVKAAARLDGQEPLDQNTKRQQKVQRFKREREIKAKMADVQMKRMRIAHIQEEVNPAECCCLMCQQTCIQPWSNCQDAVAYSTAWHPAAKTCRNADEKQGLQNAQQLR
jgi:hypothetical protein